MAACPRAPLLGWPAAGAGFASPRGGLLPRLAGQPRVKAARATSWAGRALAAALAWPASTPPGAEILYLLKKNFTPLDLCKQPEPLHP